MAGSKVEKLQKRMKRPQALRSGVRRRRGRLYAFLKISFSAAVLAKFVKISPCVSSQSLGYLFVRLGDLSRKREIG